MTETKRRVPWGWAFLTVIVWVTVAGAAWDWATLSPADCEALHERNRRAMEEGHDGILILCSSTDRADIPSVAFGGAIVFLALEAIPVIAQLWLWRHPEVQTEIQA